MQGVHGDREAIPETRSIEAADTHTEVLPAGAPSIGTGISAGIEGSGFGIAHTPLHGGIVEKSQDSFLGDPDEFGTEARFFRRSRGKVPPPGRDEGVPQPRDD